MARNFCVRCGKPLSGSDRFCMYCGTPVDADGPAPAAAPRTTAVQAAPSCPRCGKPVGRADRFCMGCGAALGGADAPVPRHLPFWKRRKKSEATQPPVAPPPAARPVPAPVPASPWGTPAGVSSGAPFDEETTVLSEPGSRPFGNDEATTVLGESMRVTLERRRTGERMEVTLPCVVGKGSQADCKISGNTAVSRRHVRLFEEFTTAGAPRLVAEDLGSLNKTRLNGDLMSEGVPRAVLNGDHLTLADEEFVVHVDEA